MRKTAFIVRRMELTDIGNAMKLSNAEGWNQTEKDWGLFIENPGNVCMVAECDNKVIGTTTVINYSNQVAWIGMVLVDKDYRGQGISKSLLTNVFEKLESCKSIKLDATPAGQQVYKRLDFRDEYTIARMVNSSIRRLPPDGGNVLLPEPIQLKHLPGVIALDEIIFGANRSQLIKYLVSEYPGKAWLVKRNNQVAGFALGRDGNKYHHIGPVVASNTTDARILVTNSIKNLINQPVAVDVLCDKEELLDWLSSIGFTQQRLFTRMYKKENILPGIVANQYLIGGPEFG